MACGGDGVLWFGQSFDRPVELTFGCSEDELGDSPLVVVARVSEVAEPVNPRRGFGMAFDGSTLTASGDRREIPGAGEGCSFTVERR